MTDVILVERLDQSLTWDGDPSFHVTGIYPDGRTGVFQASTLSAFIASQIDLAQRTQQPIAVEWKPGPIRNKYIVSVQLKEAVA